MPPEGVDRVAKAAELLQSGALAAAEQTCLSLLAREEHPEAMNLLGQARLKQNRLNEALIPLQRSLAIRPNHADTLLHLGKVLARLGRDAEAARAVSDAALQEPELTEAWYDLGEIQQRLGDFAAAETSFRKLLALRPGHQLGKLALGLTLKEAGRITAADSVFAEGFAQSDAPLLKAAFAYNLALVQYDQGRKDAALSSFALVSQLDPDRGAAHLARAGILAETRREDEALLLLEKVIQREPLNEAVHAVYNDLLYRHGRDADFLKSYDRAPPAAALQMGKAGFLLKAGRQEEARALYDSIAAREPENLHPILGAAAALNQLGRHGEAFTRLERALLRHPASLPLYHQLAVTACGAREPQRAAAMAAKALALAPLDQYSLALQGSTWRMLGDERDEVLNAYDELIAIFDLNPPDDFSTMAEFNRELSSWLSQLHPMSRAPLNQTLRGGTQTRGHLFATGHFLMEKLKAHITEAMDQYIAEMGSDALHPFRSRGGKGFRVTGSWSSRLSDCGYHVNHIHPDGWISSCYYVDVPPAVENEEEQQGWITFGEPSFDAGLSPRRTVRPVPGRLILFPSYMWHGTNPFHDASPRTTIAFDAIPRAL